MPGYLNPLAGKGVREHGEEQLKGLKFQPSGIPGAKTAQAANLLKEWEIIFHV
jgi:hypothetical protein